MRYKTKMKLFIGKVVMFANKMGIPFVHTIAEKVDNDVIVLNILHKRVESTILKILNDSILQNEHTKYMVVIHNIIHSTIPISDIAYLKIEEKLIHFFIRTKDVRDFIDKIETQLGTAAKYDVSFMLNMTIYEIIEMYKEEATQNYYG